VAREILEEYGAAFGVAQGDAPVGVFGGGARHVLGAPVADGVG
jgi:hypothetical protein